MSAMFSTLMTSVGPFGLADIGDGVFSPASPILDPVTGQFSNTQQVIPFGVERTAVRVEDIYINSFGVAGPAPHALEIWYAPTRVLALPQTPDGANNYTQIYSYAARSNCNPFQQDDGATPPRRLTKLVFGDIPAGIIPFGGQGTLQFVVGAGFTDTIQITIHWSLVNPGGGVGT
jgi:hypothetical protein